MRRALQISSLLCAALLTMATLRAAEPAQLRMLAMPSYSVRTRTVEYPAIDIYQEGQLTFRLPLASGLSTPDAEERLSHFQLTAHAESGGGERWEVTADSDLWSKRRFVWLFLSDHIEFQQFATGAKPVERCYFFSNGISDRWTNGTSPGVFANTSILASRYFSPQPNHADQYYNTIAMPQSVGVLEEGHTDSAYHPELMTGLFAPPPLWLAFEKQGAWAGLGIGTIPGEYLFNGLEYSGSKYAGASFWVNYRGYISAAKGFASPLMAIHFGFSEFDTLQKYMAWMDEKGFGTRHSFAQATWHYLPIFCGWAEQTREASLGKAEAHDLATQANYEKWIEVIEKRGLRVGTVVIDDKWQKYYGTFEVDEKKWPDFKGFVARQHAKGRHVVLWVPAFHKEGVPEALCVKQDGRAIAGDVTNPEYERFLRDKIHRLVAELGVDGFKEDWVSGVSRRGGVAMQSPVFGIEFVRRFQFILYDETHKWKRDAMVETQTPNPLFRESSDVLRLNDIWYGARQVPAMMRRRARIAKIAGWPLVDCDNASSTNLEEWWNYMQEQPSIGIPALYFVYQTETTMEEVPDSKWQQLAEIWKEYVKTRETAQDDK
jgi:hypothetical protein